MPCTHLTDRSVDTLLARDSKMPLEFFIVWRLPLCYPLARKVLNFEVDYDQLVGERRQTDCEAEI